MINFIGYFPGKVHCSKIVSMGILVTLNTEWKLQVIEPLSSFIAVFWCKVMVGSWGILEDLAGDHCNHL